MKPSELIVALDESGTGTEKLTGLAELFDGSGADVVTDELHALMTSAGFQPTTILKACKIVKGESLEIETVNDRLGTSLTRLIEAEKNAEAAKSARSSKSTEQHTGKRDK